MNHIVRRTSDPPGSAGERQKWWPKPVDL